MAALPDTHRTEPEHWRVRRRSDGRAVVSEWEDILAATHVAFDIRLTHRTPSSFQGDVVRRRFGELMLIDCASTPFSGHPRAC